MYKKKLWEVEIEYDACKQRASARMLVQAENMTSKETSRCRRCDPLANSCGDETFMTVMELPIAPGYWRTNEFSPDMLKCVPKEACIGSSGSVDNSFETGRRLEALQLRGCVDAGASDECNVKVAVDDEAVLPLKQGVATPPFPPPLRNRRLQSATNSTGNWSLCYDYCRYAYDGDCDDGGPGSQYSACSFGWDCYDCGARYAGAPPTPVAPPPPGQGPRGSTSAPLCRPGHRGVLCASCIHKDSDGSGESYYKDAKGLCIPCSTADGTSAPQRHGEQLTSHLGIPSFLLTFILMIGFIFLIIGCIYACRHSRKRAFSRVREARNPEAAEMELKSANFWERLRHNRVVLVPKIKILSAMLQVCLTPRLVVHPPARLHVRSLPR